MDLYLYPSHVAPIAPETIERAYELLGDWLTSADRGAGFTVDIQSDRAQVTAEGGLDPATVEHELRSWAGKLSSSGVGSFYVNEWQDLFELRRRADFVVESGGYRATPDASGNVYSIEGGNGLDVGVLHISRDGWVGVSSAVDLTGTATRTGPFATPREALAGLLRALGYDVN